MATGGGVFLDSAQQPLKPFIISPYNAGYRAWEIFLVVLVAYSAWASPFQLGFSDDPIPELVFFDRIINSFFAVDIVLTFFVAYLDTTNYVLVDNHQKIAKKYAVSWFIVDIVSTIPLEFVQRWKPLFIMILYTMLRLRRIRRVCALFSRLENNINLNYVWVKFVEMICGIIFLTNCAGCFYYGIAANYLYPEQTWIGSKNPSFKEDSILHRYVTSLYWCASTLSTVGYGDYGAKNMWEMIFAIFFLPLVLFVSACVAHVVGMLFEKSNRTQKFKDNIESASIFARRHQLPAELEDQMLSHLSSQETSELLDELEEQKMVESLPKNLQSRINHYTFNDIIEEAYLFKGVSKIFLSQLVVIEQNETPTDLYIIASGAVDLLVGKDRREQVVGKASKKGDVCGEIGVLLHRPQPFTVRAASLTKLIRVERAKLLFIVRTNEVDGTIIMINLEQKMKKSNDPTVWEILIETEFKAAHWKRWPAKVTVSCPEKGDVRGKDVVLPRDLYDLRMLCVTHYGFYPKRVLNKELGGVVDCIDLVRAGDHLVFTSQWD